MKERNVKQRFFKIFTILFIINIFVSLAIYIVSPPLIPLSLTDQGFGDYRSKTHIFTYLLLPLGGLLIGIIAYKPMLVFWKTYPAPIQKFYLAFCSLLTGINPQDERHEVIIANFIAALVLAIAMMIVLIIFTSIPVFRIITKKINS